MTDAPPLRLSDRPDWHYVLQEFFYHYRYGSAGGSTEIARHMREVQRRISRAVQGDAVLSETAPAEKPVCRHLSRALDRGEQGAAESFIRAVSKIAPDLNWQYGYDKMPRALEKKYAYAEIMGPAGPVVCEDLILGLVLFAPKCTYPSHSHANITESYVCLSGFVSENHGGVFPPGTLILNRPGFTHTITTPDREPVLLAYAWVGDPADLGSFEMVFERRRTDG